MLIVPKLDKKNVIKLEKYKCCIPKSHVNYVIYFGHENIFSIKVTFSCINSIAFPPWVMLDNPAYKIKIKDLKLNLKFTVFIKNSDFPLVVDFMNYMNIFEFLR